MKKSIIVLLILVLTVSWVFPQTPMKTKSDDPRYIINPETGKLSMNIRVWGEVKRPGVTLVPSDADLISLLSFVGGPTSTARLDKIHIIRYNVRKGEPIVVYGNIEAFLKDGNTDHLPAIYPNDTIIVKGSVWKVFSGVLSYVGVVLQIMQIYFYLYSVNR